MPIRPPKEPPKDSAEWARWARQVAVEPDDGTVGTQKIQDQAVTNAKLRFSAGASVVGRSASSGGALADIVASNGEVLIGRSGGLVFDFIADADLPTSIARDSEVSAGNAATLAAANVVSAGALAAHVADPDPHPQYLTAAEGNAAYAALESTGTYTGAYTGTATNPAPVLRWSKVGKLVALYVPQSSATSNATGFTITGAPAAIRPARTQVLQAIVRDNNVVSAGLASMDTSGVLTLGLTLTAGNFTATGVKGLELQTLTYSLD